ncbi:unnamed protein product, partial [marine sediment metagenome]
RTYNTKDVNSESAMCEASWDGGTSYTQRFMILRALGQLGFEETGDSYSGRAAQGLTLEQDIYGIVLQSLHMGLPYIGIYGEDLIEVEGNIDVQEAYNFGNKYA